MQVWCIITLSSTECVTFTALHVCKGEYVWFLYVRINVFKCAHIHICVCTGVCMHLRVVSRRAAVTQWGFTLKCKLSGMAENDRCEIMRKDGMGNERNGCAVLSFLSVLTFGRALGFFVEAGHCVCPGSLQNWGETGTSHIGEWVGLTALCITERLRPSFLMSSQVSKTWTPLCILPWWWHLS